MLPPSCKVVLVNPRTNITIPQSGWAATDLKYSLVLSKLSHVIIMYQYTGQQNNSKWAAKAGVALVLMRIKF